MNCYKCEHKADVDAFAEWDRGDKSTPCPISEERRQKLIKACSSCCVEPSHKGRSHVREDSTTFTRIDHDYIISRLASARPTNLPTVEEDNLKRILCLFADLSLHDAPVAIGFLKAMSLREIAHHLKWSRAKAHARVKAMLARCPWMIELHKSRLFGASYGKAFRKIDNGLAKRLHECTVHEADGTGRLEILPTSARPVRLVSVLDGHMIHEFPSLASYCNTFGSRQESVVEDIRRGDTRHFGLVRIEFADMTEEPKQ